MNGWWEWLPATITRVFAVKNRSHNPKTADTKIKVSSKIRLDARGQRWRLHETSLSRLAETVNPSASGLKVLNVGHRTPNHALA